MPLYTIEFKSETLLFRLKKKTILSKNREQVKSFSKTTLFYTTNELSDISKSISIFSIN